MTRRYCKNDINLYNYFCVVHITREGVRSIASVALATPFFRCFLYEIAKKKFAKHYLCSEISNALPDITYLIFSCT